MRRIDSANGPARTLKTGGGSGSATLPVERMSGEPTRHACGPDGGWKLLARMLLRSAGRRVTGTRH